LKEPPDTLLLEFYNPKEDHPLTLHILREFEKKGVIPSQTHDEIVDEDSAVQQFMEQRRRERELNEAQKTQQEEKRTKVDITVATPDVNKLRETLKKSPTDLRLTLENLDDEKKKQMEELERSARLERLKLLMEMKKIGKQGTDDKLETTSAADQWTEYLLINYIKPEETIVVKDGTNFENKLADVNELEHMTDENKKLEYQFKHTAIADDPLVEQFLKSKL
jgi:hypothetical protein